MHFKHNLTLAFYFLLSFSYNCYSMERDAESNLDDTQELQLSMLKAYDKILESAENFDSYLTKLNDLINDKNSITIRFNIDYVYFQELSRKLFKAAASLTNQKETFRNAIASSMKDKNFKSITKIIKINKNAIMSYLNALSNQDILSFDKQIKLKELLLLIKEEKLILAKYKQIQNKQLIGLCSLISLVCIFFIYKLITFPDDFKPDYQYENCLKCGHSEQECMDSALDNLYRTALRTNVINFSSLILFISVTFFPCLLPCFFCFESCISNSLKNIIIPNDKWNAILDKIVVRINQYLISSQYSLIDKKNL